jgi:hypothetical protein
VDSVGGRLGHQDGDEPLLRPGEAVMQAHSEVKVELAGAVTNAGFPATVRSK